MLPIRRFHRHVQQRRQGQVPTISTSHPGRGCRSPSAALPLLALLMWAPSAAAAPTPGPLWQHDLAKVQAQARANGHFILVDLYAEWCGWCKTLERKVFSTSDFQAFAAHFELLRVDVEDGAVGSRMQGTYGVDSLPTLLILDAGGIQVGAVSGYLPLAQFIEAVRQEVARYEETLERFERLRAGGEPAALRALAETLHRRRDGGRAAVLYDHLLALERPEPERLLLLTMATDAQRLGGDLARARKTAAMAHALAARLDQPILAEQVELLEAQIAQDAGDCDHAEKSLKSFLSAHPQSPMRWQARDLLTALHEQTTTCG